MCGVLLCGVLLCGSRSDTLCEPGAKCIEGLPRRHGIQQSLVVHALRQGAADCIGPVAALILWEDAWEVRSQRWRLQAIPWAQLGLPQAEYAAHLLHCACKGVEMVGRR